MLTGTVVKGKGLGRTLDFPTANLNIVKNYKLIPKQGVYVVKSIIDEETVFGMMNIGTNPTVNGKTQTIEVHFFNLDEILYGKTLNMNYLKDLEMSKNLNRLMH